jgi:hypothetical protein
MSIRSIIFTLAVCLAAGCVAENSSGEGGLREGESNADEATTTDPTTPNFKCLNVAAVQLVSCSGIVAIFPIKVDVGDVDVLSNNDLNLLNNSLNKVAILNNVNVDVNNVLQKVELEVLNVFLNTIKVALEPEDINVCTSVAGGLICR